MEIEIVMFVVNVSVEFAVPSYQEDQIEKNYIISKEDYTFSAGDYIFSNVTCTTIAESSND